MAPGEFWLKDEQVRLMGFNADVMHPSLGAYKRHGPLVQFDGETSGLTGPPLAGQHNQEVLNQCGYEREEVERLTGSGVLWQESSTSG